jgi:hypothetical protein
MGLAGCVLLGRILYVPGFLASGNCQQPCWQGVRPGETEPDVALTLLWENNLIAPEGIWPGYMSRFCWASSDAFPWEGCLNQKGLASRRFPIETIDLRPHGLMFGDVIGVFGTPLAAFTCQVVAGSVSSLTARAMTADYFYFPNNIIVRAYAVRNQPLAATPNLLVYRITYYPEGQTTWKAYSFPGWHGFSSLKKQEYCPD